MMPVETIAANNADDKKASRFIDGITVVHVLDSICVTTLEDSTTSVPYEIVITNNLDEIGEDHTFSEDCLVRLKANKTVEI